MSEIQSPKEHARYVTACPVGCTAPLTATRITLAEGALLACEECGQLVSQATAARYWETMRAFDAVDFNQPTGRELERRMDVANRRLRLIAKLLGKKPSDIRLIDVGCSRGQFVAAAADLGVQAEGVEPAARIAAAARASGLRVHEGLLEDVRFSDGAFDTVSLFEVVEHLREPLPLIRECRRILKRGGVLCLSTGNAQSWTVSAMAGRWDYFDMDKDGGHISFFNPHSLTLLAERTGFQVERIETARVRFTERSHTPRALHALSKAAAELLSFPARLAERGHDMVAYLRAQ